MDTHNLCFEQKYEKYQNFLSETSHFLVVKFSIHLNRHVFIINEQAGLGSVACYITVPEQSQLNWVSYFCLSEVFLASEEFGYLEASKL